MALRIDDNFINTQYKCKQNKNSVVNEPSFVNQLNVSKRNFSMDNKNTSSSPIYSGLGILKNTINTTTKSSSEKIEKRREEIHEYKTHIIYL